MRWQRIVGSALAVAGLALLPLFLGSSYYVHVFNLAILHAVVVLGANFITGMARQVVLGFAGVFAVGGYVCALATTKLGLPVGAGVLLAAASGVVVGFALGWPSLRLRGIYLTIATVGFGEVVRLVLINWESVTEGVRGVREVPPLSVMGQVLDDPVEAYALLLGTLLLACYVAVRISSSRFGRALRAIGLNESAAEAAGVNTAYLKTFAFALSSVYAAVAGGLYAPLVGYISPFDFTLDRSVQFIGMLIVGGMGSVPGSVAGAVLLTVLPEWLRVIQDWYMLAFGAILAAVVVFFPRGLAHAATTGWSALSRRVSRGSRAADSTATSGTTGAKKTVSWGG